MNQENINIPNNLNFELVEQQPTDVFIRNSVQQNINGDLSTIDKYREIATKCYNDNKMLCNIIIVGVIAILVYLFYVKPQLNKNNDLIKVYADEDGKEKEMIEPKTIISDNRDLKNNEYNLRERERDEVNKYDEIYELQTQLNKYKEKYSKSQELDNLQKKLLELKNELEIDI